MSTKDWRWDSGCNRKPMTAKLRLADRINDLLPILRLRCRDRQHGDAAQSLSGRGDLARSVIAAVHHAEVVAHRVGEPFGTLILALAVTVIEVGLILTLMQAEPEERRRWRATRCSRR